MQIKSFSLGPIGTNCYIISKNNECIIIDPGAESATIINYIGQNKLIPKAILLTHAHFDHIGAVDDIRNKYQIDVYIHEAEQDWLVDPALNRSVLFFGEANSIQTAKPEHILTEGILTIGPFTFDVIHTPGHSPGSMSFIFHEGQFVVSGDVLFRQSIGRTDIPGGDFHILMDSIFDKLYPLPDEYVVYSGHGPSTTIGFEKRANPFTTQYSK